MGNRARELAEDINAKVAERQEQGRLQLHRAQIINAKVDICWRSFLKTLEAEVDDFNTALGQNITTHGIVIANPRTAGTYNLSRRYDGASVDITIHAAEQTLRVASKRSGKDAPETIYSLTVNSEDEIVFKDREGSVDEEDIAMEIIKRFPF